MCVEKKRPLLTKDLLPCNFAAFYWLKIELVDFCKTCDIDTRGAKKDLTKRIMHYLETGKKLPFISKISKPKSSFNWKTETLTPDTIITDIYRNTENVRNFFKNHIGSHFSFNTLFMNWMKQASGKTLQDAIIAWEQIRIEKKNTQSNHEIGPQFEYNTYIRDFFRNNKTRSRQDAIACWNWKKKQRGSNVYDISDLNYLKKIK